MANSVPSNGFRNNCGIHFGLSPLPVSKVAVIINCVFFWGGGGGLKKKQKNGNAALDNSNGVYFLTYLLNEGWTFLVNESVKEKKKEEKRRQFWLKSLAKQSLTCDIGNKVREKKLAEWRH